MQTCECGLSGVLQSLGAAAALCPHSPPDQVQRVQQDLHQVLAQFTTGIDPDNLFQTLSPLAQTYAHSIVGDDYPLLTRNEHNTLIVSFLRQVSLSAQTMLVTMLLHREPE